MMSVYNETHPFFQSRSIPHRVVTLQGNDDNVKRYSQLTTPNHLISRKKKLAPLLERPPNTHLPQTLSDDPLPDPQQASPEVNMDDLLKKKVLKLNSNGKLLSSPPVTPITQAPVGKSSEEATSPKAVKKTRGRPRGRPRGRSPKSKPSSIIAKIGYGRESSDRRIKVGGAIDGILSATPAQRAVPSAKRLTPREKETPKKSTHPFFLGQVKLVDAISDKGSPNEKSLHSDLSTSPSKTASKRGSPRSKTPVAWKDVAFRSGHGRNQHTEALSAPWPPRYMHRVDGVVQNKSAQEYGTPSPLPSCKSKGRATLISEKEDILRRASQVYVWELEKSRFQTLRQPSKQLLAGESVLKRLQDKLLVEELHPATKRLHSSLDTSLTAFEQGRCDQSSWTTKSSPSAAEEVLQPGPEAVVLRDWLRKLTVTAVEDGKLADKVRSVKHNKRKRGRPKRPGDVDDFIVSSEDEAEELTEIDRPRQESTPFANDAKRSVLKPGVTGSSHAKMRLNNTMLLSGPSGCGKTASVYAVARELGFEVFEIHPGARRGAKEIFERVGDMTQNHLVQQQSEESFVEEAPVTSIDDAAVQSEIASGKQRTMNGFFQPRAQAERKAVRKRKAVQQDDQKECCTKKARKVQKQSLILLEEVDNVFDDDRSFWSGVQSLIEHSKRPIILTCNDESALPLADLDLDGTLRYSAPPEDMATDYLLTLAASEGHDLRRDAVSHLYSSKGGDLRATISELDFWCQMGVGSRKGGLDWMPDWSPSPDDKETVKTKPRVLSTDTYLRGMGLTLHQPDPDPEQLLLDAHQQLNLPVALWSSNAAISFTGLTTIRDASTLADFHSDLDLCRQEFDDLDPTDLQLRIAVSLTTRLLPKAPTSRDIINKYVDKAQRLPCQPQLTRSNMFSIFEPLTKKKQPFPPSHGRLAPTLELSSLSQLAADVAPYVRSIVAFEERWGASAPVAKRHTRASAKPESYFPKQTNAKYVLMTGGSGWQDLGVEEGGRDVG